MPRSLRHRLLLAPLLAAGLAVPLRAADAPVDATQFLPPAALTTLRLNDLPRSRVRFAATPFAKLLTSGWGQLLTAKLDVQLQELAKQGIDVVPMLRALTTAAGGLAIPAKDQFDIGAGVQTSGDAASLRAMLTQLTGAEPTIDAGTPTWVVGGGQLTAFGQLLGFRSAPPGGGLVTAAAPRSPAVPAAHPEACLEGKVDVKALTALLRTVGGKELDDPALGRLDDLSFTLALDPIGIREHWDTAFPAAQAAALAQLAMPPANLDLLRTLPAATLFALTVRADAKSTKQIMALTGADSDKEQMAKLDAALARVDMPPVATILQDLDGDILLYCEEGVPFPTATLTAAMSDDLAAKLLASLRAKSDLQDSGDGTLAGMVGLVQLQAAYQKGLFILTTNPTGIAGVTARQAGFADHAEIRSALAELKPGAVAVGVSRTGPTYAAIAQLALTGMAMFGIDPKFMTMPQDLRAAGRYGFFSYQHTPTGMALDAGGLMGGVIGMYSLVGGAAGAYFTMEMAQFRRGVRGQGQGVAPPAAPKPKDPEQVF